jgi:hypothetical protein
MSVREGKPSGQLQVQRHLWAAVDLEHAKVVHLPYPRDAEGGGLHALAYSRQLLAGLDVDDDVALGDRALDRGLDRVGFSMALSDGGARLNSDHDVGEMPPCGLPQA